MDAVAGRVITPGGVVLGRVMLDDRLEIESVVVRADALGRHAGARAASTTAREPKDTALAIVEGWHPRVRRRGPREVGSDVLWKG